MDIVKWNGSAWSPVGAGFTGGFTWVSCLQIFNNELYAGGSFHLSDGNPGDAIVKWDGNNWIDVGGGMPGSNSHVDKLKVINGQLYAVGGFLIAGGVPAMVMAKWDGLDWCGFGINSSGSFVDIVQHMGEIYVACDQILDSDTVNYIAKWIGGSFVDTCGNTTGLSVDIWPERSVLVFPIPATTVINFQLSDIVMSREIIIMDNLGREIWRKETSESILEFPAAEYSNGIYFYSVIANGTVTTGKFVISH